MRYRHGPVEKAAYGAARPIIDKAIKDQLRNAHPNCEAQPGPTAKRQMSCWPHQHMAICESAGTSRRKGGTSSRGLQTVRVRHTGDGHNVSRRGTFGSKRENVTVRVVHASDTLPEIRAETSAIQLPHTRQTRIRRPRGHRDVCCILGGVDKLQIIGPKLRLVSVAGAPRNEANTQTDQNSTHSHDNHALPDTTKQSMAPFAKRLNSWFNLSLTELRAGAPHLCPNDLSQSAQGRHRRPSG